MSILLENSYPVLVLGLKPSDVVEVLRVYLLDPQRVEHEDICRMSDVFAQLSPDGACLLHDWAVGVHDAIRGRRVH